MGTKRTNLNYIQGERKLAGSDRIPEIVLGRKKTTNQTNKTRIFDPRSIPFWVWLKK